MLAVDAGHAQCAENLIRSNANVNLCDVNGRTALHRASCRGFHDCVTLLLDAKASPLQKDCLGKTPLHLASSMGHVLVVKQLMQFWPGPITENELMDSQNYTPLHWAAYKGDFVCCFYFVFPLTIKHASFCYSCRS